MSAENDKNKKILGLDAIPYIKGYICNACKHSENKIRLDVDAELSIWKEQYDYIISVIESLHGPLDSFRLSNNLFGILCGNNVPDEEKDKYTKLK
jgi:hypothetical protein